MTDRERAKQRTAMLKRLREEHAATVEQTQALLKEQKAFRKQMRAAMHTGAKTVPEIATTAGLPSDQVLWHLMSMKRYDLVREIGRDGDYFEYELVEEVA